MNKRIYFLFTSFLFLLNSTLLFAYQVNTMQVKGRLTTDTLMVDTVASNSPNKKIVVLDTLLLMGLKSAKAMDGIVMVDPITGELRRKNASQLGGSNIYTVNGTLTGNRTVTMSNNNINFTGGNIGIGNANPLGPLHFDNGAANRKLILYQTVNNDHDFYGFGTTPNILRYQVGNSDGLHVFYSGVDATNSQELMRITGDGNIGIGNANPLGPLHFANTVVNRKLILYQTINNEYQFYGFGVKSNELRYQVEGATNSHVFYAGVNATSSKEIMRIQGDGKVLIPSLISTNTMASAKATDSMVTVNPATGELRRRDASKIGGSIYTRDGTLAGNRTVTMSNNNINFTGGNIGIGNANPLGPLHFENTFVNRKIILYQTINNDHQFYGFGVNSSVLRYQVEALTNAHIFYAGIDATSSKELMRIQGDGKVLVPALISTNTTASAKTTDSILMVNPITGELRRRGVSKLSSNIYATNGTLTGNRTVTMANNNIDFTGGNIGIGNATPFGPLHFDNTAVNRKIILYQTVNNEHQFYGLGVNSGVLKYQVEGATHSHVFYAGINANSSKELMRIQGDGKIFIPSLTSANASASAKTTDSILMANPTTGELRRKDASKMFRSIYNVDGTLNYYYRTITMAGKYLNFTGGNIGIGNPNPLGPLHFNNTSDRRAIVFYQEETSDNENDFSGFRTNGNDGMLRYHVDGSTTAHVFYSGINANSSKELMRIQGDGKIFIPTTLASANATDSIVTVNPITGELRRRSPVVDNIYTMDGTLTADRSIITENASISFMGGNIGINNPTPFGPLHFANTLANRKLILYQYHNNDNQFYGFGINADPLLERTSAAILRYQAAGFSGPVASHVFYVGKDVSNSALLMRISANGVGIGLTISPRAPLHITSISAISVYRNGSLGERHKFFSSYGPQLFASAINGRIDMWYEKISIYTAGAIVTQSHVIASSNLIFSDKRIKKNIILSDSKSDLNILNKIKVSNYKLIDFLKQGDGTHKKVIAQELEQVYPQAINTSTNYIPNVYQVSETITYLSDTVALISFHTPLDSECIAGRRIRFYDEEGTELYGFIKEVKEKSLVISRMPKNQKGIFVYGVEINDFKSVDYDAIAMLNVSAIQEIYTKAIIQENAIQKLNSNIQQSEIYSQKLTKQLEEVLRLLKK